jgi:hypothetical protein
MTQAQPESSVVGGFSPARAAVSPFGDHEACNSAGPHPFDDCCP